MKFFVPTTKRKYKFNLVEIANVLMYLRLTAKKKKKNTKKYKKIQVVLCKLSICYFVVLKSLSNLEGGGGGFFEEYSVETQYPDM